MGKIKELTAHLGDDASIDEILDALKDLPEPEIEFKECQFCGNSFELCICI